MTIKNALALIEPFVVVLLMTVAAAAILPPRGPAVLWFKILTFIAIFLLFFLHGAKLSRQAILSGARNWKLHGATLGATYLLFPILGLAVASLPLVHRPIAAGLLFLTLLPSTVQSSIAFTAIAGGDVAAAVCSASFSNLAGILVTPLLVAMLMKVNSDGASLGAIKTILLQLLLPFALGHLARPWIADRLLRYKSILQLVDRGSILLVVYTAFGAAVVQGLLCTLSLVDFVETGVLSFLILILMLSITWIVGRLLGLPREDRIVLLFCGSKKSLASGVPMAGVMFSASQVGVIIVPLMLFHQLQLIACAFIARHYHAEASRAARTIDIAAASGAAASPVIP